MKKILSLLFVLFLVSCTSNTIYKKPKDLIPKDTMTLLIYDLYLANAAKHVKNKNLEKKVNYMPFVFDVYKIDSLRFQSSNLYYISKIDDYEDLLKDVKKKLEDLQKELTTKKVYIDSIRRDSISRANKSMPKITDPPTKTKLSEDIITKE